MKQLKKAPQEKSRRWEYKEEEMIALREEKLKKALLEGMCVREIVQTILILGLRVPARRRDRSIARDLLDKVGQQAEHEQHREVITEIRSRIETAVNHPAGNASDDDADFFVTLNANEKLEGTLPIIQEMLLQKGNNEVLRAIVALINERISPYPELNANTLTIDGITIQNDSFQVNIRFTNGGKAIHDTVSLSMREKDGDGHWWIELCFRKKKKTLRILKDD